MQVVFDLLAMVDHEVVRVDEWCPDHKDANEPLLVGVSAGEPGVLAIWSEVFR